MLVVATLYVAVSLFMYFAQDALVFPATRGTPPEVRADGRLEPIELAVADGVTLRGAMRKPLARAGGRAPLLVYFGGNGEEVTWWRDEAGWPGDWAVALVNYRGFGRSDGTPSEAALYADALRLYDALAARSDVDPSRIVLYGRSLGSGVATRVALERPAAAVVLVTPFDSVAALAAAQYPWLPVDWLLKHRFDSMERAPRIAKPLLMLVAEDDEVIPVAHSLRLYEAWSGPKRLARFRAVGHQNITDAIGFWDDLGHFLRLIPAGAPVDVERASSVPK